MIDDDCDFEIEIGTLLNLSVFSENNNNHKLAQKGYCAAIRLAEIRGYADEEFFNSFLDKKIVPEVGDLLWGLFFEFEDGCCNWFDTVLLLGKVTNQFDKAVSHVLSKAHKLEDEGKIELAGKMLVGGATEEARELLRDVIDDNSSDPIIRAHIISVIKEHIPSVDWIDDLGACI